MTEFRKHIALVLVIFASFGTSSAMAGLVAAVDFAEGGTASGFGDSPRTAGWRFELTRAETLAGLGFWDEGADGLSVNHQVGLWTDDGVLVTSAIVNNQGLAFPSASSNGSWIFTKLNDLISLEPGIYRVAGLIDTDFTADLVRSFFFDDSSLSFAAPVSWLNPAFGPPSSGFQFPELIQDPFITNINGYYGANFLLIPEPDTVALLALGFFALRSMGTHRSKHKKVCRIMSRI